MKNKFIKILIVGNLVILATIGIFFYQSIYLDELLVLTQEEGIKQCLDNCSQAYLNDGVFSSCYDYCQNKGFLLREGDPRTSQEKLIKYISLLLYLDFVLLLFYACLLRWKYKRKKQSIIVLLIALFLFFIASFIFLMISFTIAPPTDIY